MNIKEFIKKLEIIESDYGSDLEVIMADFLEVVPPVFIEHRGRKFVVITDEE